MDDTKLIKSSYGNQVQSTSFGDVINDDIQPKHLRFSRMNLQSTREANSAILESNSFDDSNSSTDFERAPVQSPYFKNQQRDDVGRLQLQDLEVQTITHKNEKLLKTTSPNSIFSSSGKLMKKAVSSKNSKYSRDVSVKRWNDKLKQTKNLKNHLMTTENKFCKSSYENHHHDKQEILNRSHHINIISDEQASNKISRKSKVDFCQSRNKKHKQLKKYSHNTIQQQTSTLKSSSSNNKPKHSFNLNQNDSSSKKSGSALSNIYQSPTKSSIKKQNSSMSRVKNIGSQKSKASKESTSPVFKSSIPQQANLQGTKVKSTTNTNNGQLDDAIHKIESVMLGKQNKINIQLNRKSPKVGLKGGHYQKSNLVYRSKTPTNLSSKFLQNSNSASNSSLKKSNHYHHNFVEQKFTNAEITTNVQRRLSTANIQFKSNNHNHLFDPINQTQAKVQQETKPHHYMSNTHKRNITSLSSSSKQSQRAPSKAQVRKSFGMAVTVRNYYSMMLKIPFRKFIKRYGNYEHILKFCYKRVVPIIERAMIKFIAMKKIKKSLRNFCGRWKFWKDLNKYYTAFLPQIVKIQRNYRNYKYRPRKLDIKKFKSQLHAIFIAWRLRKVLMCSELNTIKKQTKQNYKIVQELRKDKSQSSKMFLRNVKRQFVHLVKDFNASIEQIIMKGTWIKRRFGISYAMKKSNSHGMLKKAATQKNASNNKRQTAANSSTKHNLNPSTKTNNVERNLCKIVGTSIQDKNTRLKQRYEQSKQLDGKTKMKLHLDKNEEQKTYREELNSNGTVRTPKCGSSKGFKKLQSSTPNYATSSQKARLNNLIQGSRKKSNNRLHQKTHSNSMADFQTDQFSIRYSHKFNPISVKQYPKNAPSSSGLNRSQQSHAMNFSIVSSCSNQHKPKSSSSNNGQIRNESSSYILNEFNNNSSKFAQKIEQQNDLNQKKIEVVSAKIASPQHRFKKKSQSKNKLVDQQPKEQKQILGQISCLFDVVKNKVKTKSDAKNEFQVILNKPLTQVMIQELMKKLQKQLQIECEEHLIVDKR